MVTSNPLLSIPDYEARAKETIPKSLFDHQFGAYGAHDWVTMTNNLAALAAIKLRPRVLRDVSHRSLSTEVLGQRISFPVMLAPAGTHQRAHPEGELASARAAGSVGTILALSTASSYSIEEVAEVATGPLWFQLYYFPDRALNENLVRRAEEAGYTTLVLTVDNAAGQTREREYRYAYTLELERRMANLVGIELPNVPTADNFANSMDPGLNWSNVDWLRSITSLPLVVKGIQTAEDARLCLEHGVDGIIVSNHGGHCLEGSSGTIEMLPEVVDAAGDKLEVFVDGGIRRGTDVLKSLALGAKAVFIGRAMFWGLSVDGEAGVRHVLEILREELDVTMGLCGVTDVNNVEKSVVLQPNGGRNGDDTVRRLERLAGLLERGYLTREEFEAQKAKLLDR